MKNIKLVVEYDGTNYCGWQRQINAVSIEDKLRKAIEGILREEVKIVGSSRTDAGVHAKGQVVNFFTEATIPTERLSNAINSKLPPDIAVLEAEEVDLDFHSRYSCKGKRYSYTILNRKMPSPIYRNYAAHCSHELDFLKMKRAGEHFLGTKDFTAFKSTGSSAKTSVRTINYIEVTKEEDFIKIFIEADGFLYNMVRIIAGTLIDVGRNKIYVEDIPDIINSKDRNRAGKTAPAQGLCLEKIYY